MTNQRRRHLKSTQIGISRIAAVFAGAIAALPGDAGAATPSLIGASAKICQLTGDTDWATNQPTAARTLSQFGLDAVDLGFPVESGGDGPLYFLFGDALPVTHGVSSVPPDDALGWTTRTAIPDPGTCLGLQLATSAPQTFAHPTVTPAIQQGSFNVPSGGVFLNHDFNAFFWTDHCVFPGTLTPDPAAPLSLPPPEPLCAEIPVNNSVGRSALAHATQESPVAFEGTVPVKPGILPIPRFPQMPSGFVYVSAATPLLVNDNGFVEIVSDGRRPWIPVYGVARYRASIPYLAMAPQDTFNDPMTWRFFAGRVGANPIWLTRNEWESGRAANGEWAPPLAAEIYQPAQIGDRCVGEHSLTWNVPLHAWLLLYGCGLDGVEARTAPEPWGPWSSPIVLLSPSHDPNVVCRLVQQLGGCAGLRNYWNCPSPGSKYCPAGTPWPGFFYAPFVMNRFTRDATPTGMGSTRRATIYWLVST